MGRGQNSEVSEYSKTSKLLSPSFFQVLIAPILKSKTSETQISVKPDNQVKDFQTTNFSHLSCTKIGKKKGIGKTQQTF